MSMNKMTKMSYNYMTIRAREKLNTTICNFFLD